MNEKEEPKHGKKPNQKLKPYLVLQYLQRNTDENHLKIADDVVEYLVKRGIDAERRSIYEDIKAINTAMLLVYDDAITMRKAIETINEDTDDINKTIIYDKSRKGFYVQQRLYDVEDIRLINECIYSAKFLSEGQTKRLSNVICEFVSKEQAKEIQHDAILTERIKTINKNVIQNLSKINEAMRNEREPQPHVPEKITFKYLKYSINDLKQQVERRHGDSYQVSPYALLLTDSNYYLLAFEDKSQKIKTYRVDRMRDVRLTQEPREGAEAFAAVDLKSYTQRVFGMFSGEQNRVTIRFINHLLDTVIDRFGTNGVHYLREDDTHFTINAPIEISDQFFGWLCGFGKRAKIISPPKVVEQFTEYVDKIRSIY